MLGPHLGQNCLGLDECPSGLNKIINNNDVAARRVSLLHANNALSPVTNLDKGIRVGWDEDKGLCQGKEA